MSTREEFRHIIRIAGVDISGNEKVPYALLSIKGIGYNTAKALCYILNIDANKRLGELTEGELKKIENIITSKKIEKIPSWILNRRKDYEEGADIHLVTSELIFYAKRDIEREKKIRSWKGVRHSLGLKVRGQRTRTTGRSGGTVGVSKKRAAQPGGAQQGGK
ncbi:30S ribosomal protein S13 [Sulfolobales archaeon HS-7]|nr:30S ribosomal protein S13 [Sulfolobales archaeon HS-7]